VSKFAREKIQPLVREMDEKGHMPDHLIKELFSNGVKLYVVHLVITECGFDDLQLFVILLLGLLVGWIFMKFLEG